MPHVLGLSSALGNIGKALTHLQFAMSDAERGAMIQEHWLESAAKELCEAVREVSEARGEVRRRKRIAYGDRDPFADDTPCLDAPPMFCHPDPDKTFDELITETREEQLVKVAGNGRHPAAAPRTA